MLLEKGSSPNLMDEMGSMPLAIAALHGHMDCVKCLVESGKIDNVNAQDYDGNTALHLACQRGHVDIAQFLVEKAKAYVDSGILVCLDKSNALVDNGEGCTPLQIAAAGDVSIVNMLVSNGANIDVFSSKVIRVEYNKKYLYYCRALQRCIVLL